MAEPAVRLFLGGSQGKASRGSLCTAELVRTKACVHICTLTENFFGGDSAHLTYS